MKGSESLPQTLVPHVVDLRYFKLWIMFDQINKFEISKVYTIRLQKYRKFDLRQRKTQFLSVLELRLFSVTITWIYQFGPYPCKLWLPNTIWLIKHLFRLLFYFIFFCVETKQISPRLQWTIYKDIYDSILKWLK